MNAPLYRSTKDLATGFTITVSCLGRRAGWFAEALYDGKQIAHAYGHTRRETETLIKKNATVSPLPAHLLPRE